MLPKNVKQFVALLGTCCCCYAVVVCVVALPDRRVDTNKSAKHLLNFVRIDLNKQFARLVQAACLHNRFLELNI